jgi:transcriptional regulator with XRE-family HTH domain
MGMKVNEGASVRVRVQQGIFVSMTLVPDLETAPDVVIGARIHHVMWTRRMSQVELAELLGIAQPTLSKKLRGQRPWFAAELILATRALGITVGWLFGETDEPAADNVRPKGFEPLTFWSGVSQLWAIVPVLRTDDLALAA